MGTGAEPHSPRTKTKAMVQLEWKNKVIKSISAGRSWVPPAPATPPPEGPSESWLHWGCCRPALTLSSHTAPWSLAPTLLLSCSSPDPGLGNALPTRPPKQPHPRTPTCLGRARQVAPRSREHRSPPASRSVRPEALATRPASYYSPSTTPPPRSSREGGPCVPQLCLLPLNLRECCGSRQEATGLAASSPWVTFSQKTREATWDSLALSRC